MIVCNGIVGACLLWGGVRHREQDFQAQGASAALAVLVALTSLTMVLPNLAAQELGPAQLLDVGEERTPVGPHLPLLVDELPLVALLASHARGKRIVRGAKELRVKESDRIDAVADGLRACGTRIRAREDGWEITEKTRISGKPVYAAQKIAFSPSVPSVSDAKDLAGELKAEYVMQQITRMETAIGKDAELARRI